MGTRVKPMIKVKDIVEKYSEFEINEEDLKNILVEPKPKTVWDLKPGDKYYVLYLNGDIEVYTWKDTDFHRSTLYLGSGFLTYEEAEFERGRRKVETELIRLGGTRDMMSLGDGNVMKYCIGYDNDTTERIRVAQWSTTSHQGCIYFQTNQDCRAAIDMIGEDVIKKFLFHVE